MCDSEKDHTTLGRPSDFTQELADEICERIADGETLRAICSAEDKPNKATVFRWLAAHESFRDQYARAREVQVETLAEEVIEIADAPAKSLTAVQHARNRTDARKWFASKVLPKKYGDKIDLDHSGKVEVSVDREGLIGKLLGPAAPAETGPEAAPAGSV